MRDAVAALREVADAARSFDDIYEVAFVQSEAADALWPYDEQAARAILRRAWESATAPGVENKIPGLESTSDPKEAAQEVLTAARHFIIKAAAKHDSRLADTFVRDLVRDSDKQSATSQGGEQDSTKQDGQTDNEESPPHKERSLSPAGFQRLAVADQLLAEGDFKSAAEMAAPVVAEGPTQMLLAFINSLRAQDAHTADALYLHLIEATRADAGTDANDILLLASPIVSPSLYTYVRGDGSTNFAFIGRIGDEEKLAPISAQVRGAFFEAAASVLLRPPVPSADGGQDEETAARYYAAGHLLPFFERDAPQYAPALNARMAALASELAPGLRDSLTSRMDVNSLSPKNPADPLAGGMDEISRAQNTVERDSARLYVVMSAAHGRLWDRARNIAAEIEDAEVRRGARLGIAIRQVMDISHSFESDEGDAFERAADLVRAADVPPEVRAVGLAQAAELASRGGKRARAGELLTEATGYAAQAERGTERATALSLVALSAARADATRLWEFLPMLVGAANESDDLRFDALFFEFILSPEDKIPYALDIPDAPTKLPDVFAAAAKLDAARTFAEARNFKDEEVRAAALLAAARAALRKSPGTTAATTR
ncbi:MAG TPA: hypothetical protein VLJ61_09360 [Pyrinomonadaceae bacterium]|nr:hypothetical protein [Pyrinomonadaceae bacterium]